MPAQKKATSWRPPTKRTSFQDAKKRRPDAESAPRRDRTAQPTSGTARPAQRSENRSDTRSDYRPDRSAPRSDSRPAHRSDNQSDNRSENRSDSRPDYRSDQRSAPRSENRSDTRSDVRSGPRSDSRSDYRSVSRSDNRSERRSDQRPDYRNNDRRQERAPRSAPQNVVFDALDAISVTADSADGMSFSDLGLGARIVETIVDMGASTPFALQAATIPVALTGRHVLGRGRTGSGKTIAFSAPLVERLLQMSKNGVKRAIGRAPRALILAPTRELALQIDRTVQPIARSVGLFTTQIYGGVPIGRQIGALERGVDIVIGTPGRIEDLIARGKLDISQILISVIDEADHMTELGFIEPVQRILRDTDPDGQRLLFSATLDAGVSQIVKEFLPNPAVFEVEGENQQSSTIDHQVYVVEQRDKREIIMELAKTGGKVLMFARTRAFAEELADILDDNGIPAVSLHGDLNQARRARNLEKLTSGRVSVLVATDVAARGIHVDDIDTVVQVDPPDDFKSYVHRSGRTGRAGKKGTVITLTTRSRSKRLMELMKQAGIQAHPRDMRPSDVKSRSLV